jgi:hypothetical protein
MKAEIEQKKVTMRRTPEQIIDSGCVTRHEHLYLRSLLLADRQITASDRSQINRVIEYVQLGRLSLVD